MAEPRNRYSTVSLVLHWLIAALVVTQVALISAHEATEGPNRHLDRGGVPQHLPGRRRVRPAAEPEDR